MMNTIVRLILHWIINYGTIDRFVLPFARDECKRERRRIEASPVILKEGEALALRYAEAANLAPA